MEYHSIESEKPLQQYVVDSLYFHSFLIFSERMVCSSVNIQYQSIEIGSFPFMDEIELKQSIQKKFKTFTAPSDGRVCKYFL